MAEEPSPDLISMADIARLAGEKRATVGNWKARNPDDFPRERGRGARGPLYDRDQVVAWLEATNRLNTVAPELEALWKLANLLRGELSSDEVMLLLLLLLAIMSKSPTEWQRVHDAPPAGTNKAVRAAARELFPFAEDVLPRQSLPDHALADTIATLATIDRLRVRDFADVLLDQAATAKGHSGGAYRTPQLLRDLVLSIAEPTGSVYNPATGLAQLMIDADARAEEWTQFFGQEINQRVWAMAQLNLAIHDVDANIAIGDVLTEDHFPQLRADRVVSIPPWNRRVQNAAALADDPRWVFGEPGPNDGIAAWIQHCLAHLGDDGRAVIVLPNAALFESGRAGRVRQRIIKAGLLDAVFALPGGVFQWTGAECAVLVFVRGRAAVEGKPAPTLMVDLTAASNSPGRTPGLTTDLINDAVELYQGWTRGQAPEREHAALATFDELAANDFVIVPSRYLSVPLPTSDLKGATRARDELMDRLEALIRASRDADARLDAILGGRR